MSSPMVPEIPREGERNTRGRKSSKGYDSTGSVSYTRDLARFL
jgi:hypothetical protein